MIGFVRIFEIILRWDSPQGLRGLDGHWWMARMPSPQLRQQQLLNADGGDVCVVDVWCRPAGGLVRRRERPEHSGHTPARELSASGHHGCVHRALEEEATRAAGW